MKNDKGPTMYEDGSLSSTANPWAKQIASDLQSLAGLDEGRELLALLAELSHMTLSPCP